MKGTHTHAHSHTPGCHLQRQWSRKHPRCTSQTGRWREAGALWNAGQHPQTCGLQLARLHCTNSHCTQLLHLIIVNSHCTQSVYTVMARLQCTQSCRAMLKGIWAAACTPALHKQSSYTIISTPVVYTVMQSNVGRQFGCSLHACIVHSQADKYCKAFGLQHARP